jgi:hypothetical protein
MWAKRVAEWRASGVTAAEYCSANGLSLSRLRYWAYKRGGSEVSAGGRERVTFAPRLARVVATRERPSTGSAGDGVVVEVGGARVHVRRGFDRAVLAEVVDVLVNEGGRR